MINPMELTGKHYVVTGASSGIGAETCRQIAKLGGKVSLLARDEERLNAVMNSLEGNAHRCYSVELSEPKNIESVIRTVLDEQGKIDGGVYCAGISDTCPLRMAKPDRIKKITSINYLSYIEFIRCITSKQNRNEKMSIVGISSFMSERGEKGLTMYCSTKAAMNGAMRAMAHELANFGIRVNNVLPGWVNTELLDRTRTEVGEDNLKKHFDCIQYLGEPIDPIDVANMTAYLLSDAAKSITGTEVVVGAGCLT